jgi:hypothetical protein
VSIALASKPKKGYMMRYLRMLLIAVFVLFTSSALAVDLAWDHDDPANVTGYTIYYEPTDGSEGPYNVTVTGGEVMTVYIPGDHFKPNLEYTIYATAYNLTGQSDPSVPITYTRTGWGPPADKKPIVLWIKPGNPKQVEIRIVF